MKNIIDWKFEDNFSIKILNTKNVFTPNITSNLIFKSVNKIIKKPKKILELGCGNGVIGIGLFKKNLCKDFIYASDLSKEAIEVCNENMKLNNVNAIIKKGSLYDPWRGNKFDVIINDISAISNKISIFSDWFNNVPCDSGFDGTKLTIEVLREANKYLYKKGKIFYPILSLSDKEKILNFSTKYFTSTHKVMSIDWPLPKIFYKNKKLLQNLKEKKIIFYQEKFGILIATTDVYVSNYG